MESRIVERFGQAGVPADQITMARDTYWFGADRLSPGELIGLFRDWHGPTMKVYVAAARSGRTDELHGQLVALAESQNQGRDGAIAIPATFMRVTVRCRCPTTRRARSPRSRRPCVIITAGRRAPAAALVTDHARTRGPDPADPLHSIVEPMDRCGVAVPVGLHRAIGGLHDAPTPGDLLCAGLAACQESAVRIVASLLGVQLTALEVRVTGDVDVRGALGLDAAVPVGFQALRCEVHLTVAPGTPPALLQKLQTAAERGCVVQQTLRAPPPVAPRYHWAEAATGDEVPGA